MCFSRKELSALKMMVRSLHYMPSHTKPCLSPHLSWTISLFPGPHACLCIIVKASLKNLLFQYFFFFLFLQWLNGKAHTFSPCKLAIDLISQQLSCGYIYSRLGLPWWCRGSSICLQCGRPGFDPWVGKIPWRRKWQPTPVFLPGESHGRKSLVGHSPQVAELDTTEQLHFHFTFTLLTKIRLCFLLCCLGWS